MAGPLGQAREKRLARLAWEDEELPQLLVVKCPRGHDVGWVYRSPYGLFAVAKRMYPDHAAGVGTVTTTYSQHLQYVRREFSFHCPRCRRRWSHPVGHLVTAALDVRRAEVLLPTHAGGGSR